MECRIYRQSLKITSDGEIETILAEEVPEGYRLEVTNMGIACLDKPGQILELGYVDQTDNYHVLYIDKRTNKVENHLVGTVYIAAGERPYGRLTTPDDDDVVYFNVHGKLWPVK